MNARYRSIKVKIPFCFKNHEHTVMCQGEKYWEVDALECIGTGLAIQKVWYQQLGSEDYGLVHIASGALLLQNTVPTLVEAGMWLRKVKAFCDWTQPAHTLKNNQIPKSKCALHGWIRSRTITSSSQANHSPPTRRNKHERVI